MKPLTAVIILNWNGSELLRRFLPHVIANTPRDVADIIVADNGSTDDSLAVLSNEFPEVNVLRFVKNHGFAEGYNLALQHSGYRYTVLLNSDAMPHEGWIAPLVAAMEADPKLGACQPKIHSVREPGRFEYAGAAGGFLDRHGYPYCRGRIFDSLEQDNGQYDSPAPLPSFWASGAAMMVRTELYLKLGGLEPAFFAHMEEIDLCWRMQLAGFKIATVTNSTVSHLGGASLDASDPKKTYLNFRNNLLMMHRNLPRRIGKRKLIVRRLLDTLAWARFLATLKWRHAGAIVRAHRDFARMRKSMATAPDDAPDMLRTGTNRPLSILHHNYLLGHRRFTQL